MRSNKLFIVAAMFVTLLVLAMAMAQTPAMARHGDDTKVIAPLQHGESETPEASHTAETSHTPSASQTVEASHTPAASQTVETSHTPSASQTVEASHTPAASQTVEASHTPQVSVTPSDCANVFNDISGNLFYNAIHTLNCGGVINGTGANTYSPGGNATRAQFAKIVTGAFNIAPATPGGQPSFSDVPANNFAFGYIEAGFAAGILSGFDQATCQQGGVQFPCFMPNRSITRGQLTKLVVVAGGYPLITPASGQPSFSDVSASNIFFASIETAFASGIIGGYSDSTFRPNNNIRRDEMAQVVYSAMLHRPGSGTPTPQVSHTPELTQTAEASHTPQSTQTVQPTNTPLPVVTNTPPAPTNTPAAGASVSIGDMSFSPQFITIAAGTTVTWSNTSGRPHTVTADNNSFDSGRINSGGSFSFTFTTAGTYGYYCQYHGSPGADMFGTITVTP